MKNNSILKTIFSVSFVMLIMKVFGFLKQMIMASYYGATIETDIYFLSSGFIGNTIFALCTALSISLITMYTNTIIKDGEIEANKLISSVLLVFAPIAVGISMVFYVLSPYIAKLLAPTYSQENQSSVAFFIGIFSLVLCLKVCSTIFSSILNARKKFLAPQLIGGIQSIVIIIGTVLFAKRYGVAILSYTYFITFVLEFLFLYYCVSKCFQFKITNPLRNPQIKELFQLIFPLLLGYGAVQLNQIVDKVITTTLGEGAVSALSYGSTLTQFVTSIFVASLGTVLFSHLAIYVAENDHSQVIDSIKKGMNLVVMILLPITIIAIIAANDVVDIVFKRGNFGEDAAEKTVLVMCGYAIGFCFLGIREIFVRVHYAYKDTKTPMINGTICIIINIALSIALAKPFGLFGVTFASSVATAFSALMSAITVRRHIPNIGYRKMFSNFIKMGIAGVFCGLTTSVIYLLPIEMAPIFRFPMVTLIACGVYFIVLLVLKLEEIQDITQLVIKKILGGKNNAI